MAKGNWREGSHRMTVKAPRTFKLRQEIYYVAGL